MMHFMQQAKQWWTDTGLGQLFSASAWKRAFVDVFGQFKR